MKKTHFKFLHRKRSLLIRETLLYAAKQQVFYCRLNNNILYVISIKISAQKSYLYHIMDTINKSYLMHIHSFQSNEVINTGGIYLHIRKMSK